MKAYAASIDTLVRAVNRQTEAFTQALDKLSLTMDRKVQDDDGVMEAAIKGLHKVGVVEEKADRALEGVAAMEDRLVSKEAEDRALRKDVR